MLYYMKIYFTVTGIVTFLLPHLAVMDVLPLPTATILPFVTVATPGFVLLHTALLVTTVVLPVSYWAITLSVVLPCGDKTSFSGL